MRTLTALGAVSALLLTTGVATPAPAAVLHFAAHLEGAAETPPNDSKGKGSAKATVDTVKKTISWTVSYSGLTGPATGAHFHGPAPAGESAGVAIPIPPPLASPIRGSAAITEAQIKDLRGGLWYVNVHTAAHPGGEIRGQLSQAH